MARFAGREFGEIGIDVRAGSEVVAIERSGRASICSGLAIRHELAADGLKSTMFAYPTGASDVGYML